jgi:hypothetical protein
MATTLLRPYVTLDDVKLHCSIGLDSTKYDEQIKRAINRASRYIDERTQRYYYKKSYSSEAINGTDHYDGWTIIDQTTTRGGLILTPRRAPIISVTTLVDDDTTLTENTDFYLHKESGIIERSSGAWSNSPGEIVITADLGYDSDDTATPSSSIPGDIAYYALEIASRFSGQYKKEIKNYVSGAAERVDLFSVPKDIDMALKKMRPVKLL